MKRIKYVAIICVGVILISAFIWKERVRVEHFFIKQALPQEVSFEDVQELVVASKQTKQVSPEENLLGAHSSVKTSVVISPVVAEKLEQEIHLAVPFISQAPTGNWDAYFKEACEEASVLMVHAFYEGLHMNKADAELELVRIGEEETRLFGSPIDTDLVQTAHFADVLYGYKDSTVVENPTIEQIKEFLENGEPVIVPTAGRLLQNPYFHQPGPVYHMVVIKGYTKNGFFIVNDPGTKHGQSYLYIYDVLMSAMHDWRQDGDILSGVPRVLVLHSRSD